MANRGLLNWTICPVCKRDVSMSTKGTIYAHGTRDDRCPGTGSKVPLVQALDEIRAIKTTKETT